MKPKHDSLSEIDASRYNCIVIGASAGGFNLFCKLAEAIPASFPQAIVLLTHIHPSTNNSRVEHLRLSASHEVHPAEDKMPLQPATLYIAPPGYHLMIAEDLTFALSMDEKVNYSRPSIDVLFESAARVYRETLISIILTGANIDGAEGTRIVREMGGLTIAQNPEEADFPDMPKAAIKTGSVSIVATISELAAFFENISSKATGKTH